MRGTVKRWLLVLALLGGCTPLYLPPVPDREPVQVTPRLELTGSAGLRLSRDEQLELRLALARVPEAGWLSVQWFSPNNVQVASDAVWVQPGDVRTGPSFFLPNRTPVTNGLWRAVVSFGGRLVRQFTLEVGD